LTAVSVIALVVLSCAGAPEPEPEAPEETVEPAQPEPEPQPEPKEEPQPETQPALEAAFVDQEGNELADGATVTLPTGAPPSGRIYPWSSDPGALAYVTRDGSIPTRDNYWVGELAVAGSQPISSVVEVARIYRLLAVTDEAESDVVTLRVNWQHEESPDLNAPEFSVRGQVVSGSVSLPVGGEEDPEGRLYIGSAYLGSTIYVTNDGSQPTADNYWRDGLSEGFYIYATDSFETTYRAVAVLRDVVSPVGSLTVDWTE
jgi:hypothetical protein